MSDQLTPRERAGKLVGKSTVNFLVMSGMDVADKARLVALEQVAKHALSYRVAVADELSDQVDRSVKRLSLFATLDQLEAMTDGQATNSNAGS